MLQRNTKISFQILSEVHNIVAYLYGLIRPQKIKGIFSTESEEKKSAFHFITVFRRGAKYLKFLLELFYKIAIIVYCYVSSFNAKRFIFLKEKKSDFSKTANWN